MEFQEFNINEALLRALTAMGFNTTTAIQEQTIPAALEGHDLLGTAQTGTGKTVAFLLPALEHLLQTRSIKEPRMVVLAPTRELVVQIAEEARKLARFTNLRIEAVYGGAPINRQIEKLRSGVDMLVATPGRLIDHMRRGNVKFKYIEILVLDEADRMLDMGFMPDIKVIVQQMPSQRQTMLFSATMPQPIEGLTRRFLKDPVRVAIDTARPPEAIDQVLYPVPRHLKLPLLTALLKSKPVESALVFTRTKQEADIITRQLREVGLSVGEIHGNFSQNLRTKALEGFRTGKIRILIATNVAARGLDIEGITHVINYDAPDEAENYVHRIGRTARVDADGAAWTLVTPEDEPLISSIEYLLGEKIERKMLSGFDYDVPMPDWAKLSAETILKRIERKQGSIDRWKALTR
ncbi:MAG: DEAD/DEAH box helicase [Anaerolineales bacterium]|nr:MAG: DEAD/DEAH box helicase [Anaerolineales bacterium]